MSRRRTNAVEKLEPTHGSTTPEAAASANIDAPSPTAGRKPDSFWRVAMMLWVGPLLLFIIIGVLKWVFGF